MRDTYLTINRPGRAELRVLGSRFIAEAIAVSSPGEAQQALEGIRRKMHDATHHCWAYRLGQDAAEARFSDAGEPSGTAGRPIMSALERLALTDVLLVVTRYFGGTKLGTGRLARAYGEAASAVLAACGTRECVVQEVLAVRVPHQRIGELMHVVALCGGKIRGMVHAEEAEYRVELRLSRLEEFTAALAERTAGAASVLSLGRRKAGPPGEESS